MRDLWAVTTMVSRGLFVGGVVFIAWERAPAWRGEPLTVFRTSFADTLRRVDRLQPALLAALIVSTIGLAVTSDGNARTLCVIVTVRFVVVLIGSAAWLVPIQNRLRSGPEPDAERLRTLWIRGHMARTLVSLVLFVLAAVATTV